MKIVVVGGTGHLGALAVAALRGSGAAREGRLEVVVASRRGPCRIDLGDPTTFGALAGADVVLDLADTTTHAPDALAEHCLREGLVLVEGSSDPEAVQRLAARRGREAAGAVVLGAGVFTGVSNLLAREASKRAGGTPRTLSLGISTSPYSGAGRGTVALMAAMLGRPAVRWVDGARRTEPLARGPEMRFPSGPRPTLRAAFPEQDMVGPSTGAAEADVLFAPVPGLLVAAFLLLPRALLGSRLLAAFMRGYFTVLRAWLLRGVTTRLEMVAEARGASSSRLAVSAADGMGAGGTAAAAIAWAVAERAERPRGVCFVDEVVALDDVVQRANGLGTERTRLILSA